MIHICISCMSSVRGIRREEEIYISESHYDRREQKVLTFLIVSQVALYNKMIAVEVNTTRNGSTNQRVFVDDRKRSVK
jgi:hypothetical protein